MNRWIRRGLTAFTTLGLLAAAAGVAGVQLADQRMRRQVAVTPTPVKAVSDAASLARGRYLYTSRGCIDCHGHDGAGRVVIDQGALRIKGPQIAPGPQSVTTGYRATDWDLTIRHGVRPDGTPLMIMPSQDYNRLTDDDLAALVAHVRHLPATDGGAAELKLPLPMRVLYGFGLIPDAAAQINHALAPQTPVPEGVTVEHGRYVAQMCVGCHGAGFAGGRIPGAPPEWPAAANLTPGAGGVMARYPDAGTLAAMMKNGQRPDGGKVQVMPFEALSHMSDVDVQALHLYLGTLPAREFGSR